MCINRCEIDILFFFSFALDGTFTEYSTSTTYDMDYSYTVSRFARYPYLLWCLSTFQISISPILSLSLAQSARNNTYLHPLCKRAFLYFLQTLTNIACTKHTKKEMLALAINLSEMCCKKLRSDYRKSGRFSFFNIQFANVHSMH